MTLSDPVSPERVHWSRYVVLLYHILLAGLVLTFGVMLVWRPILGWCDFWAHAAVGRWVCENGRTPDRSLFLWTADEPWVYHSWLTQVIFYGLTCVGGPDSRPAVVLGFTIAVVLAPFALAWGVWCRTARPTCWMAIPFVLALEGTALRFQTRPEMFTALFLSLLLVWLGLRRAPEPDRPLRRRLGGLALVLGVFTLWANLHGAVVLGIQVLVVTAVCDFVQNRRDGRWKEPALLAVLAPVAVCVNPYGPLYWTALEPVASSRFSAILEWYPLWRGPLLPTEMLVAACVLPALALSAWGLNRERRLAQLGWLLLFATMFALARRNIWPFAITCLVVLALNARALDPDALWRWMSRRKKPPPFPSVLRWAARAFVFAWVALQLWPVYDGLRLWRNHVPARLENGIVRFVNEEKLTGRVFNDYENSSYFQWAFAGRPALSIDLLNAYPDHVLADYRDVVGVTERGRALLNEQQIGVVILTTNRGGGVSLTPLAEHLDAQAEWVRVYAGADGVVWVRRAPEYERVWRRHEATVWRVGFGTLERWGEESQQLWPSPRPDPSAGRN
jgi:hypothetical protein